MPPKPTNPYIDCDVTKEDAGPTWLVKFTTGYHHHLSYTERVRDSARPAGKIRFSRAELFRPTVKRHIHTSTTITLADRKLETVSFLLHQGVLPFGPFASAISKSGFGSRGLCAIVRGCCAQM